MKKRILSILLLCCMVLTMVLTMLPTTAFAAGELPDVKLSVPTTFDKTVDLTKQNKELKIKDSKTYLIKGSADPNWYFQYRIKIDGKTIHRTYFWTASAFRHPRTALPSSFTAVPLPVCTLSAGTAS